MNREYIIERSIPVTESGCWLWLGAIGANGYGSITANKKQIGAHRASYMAFKGKIPKGMLVMHSCDTPTCVNPDHLSIGTHSDNMRDKSHKHRGNSPSGTRHRSHKLTLEDVRNIRLDQRKQQTIAFEYGVSHQTIWAIKTGLIWRIPA